jgi:hypothetical protein
LTQNGTEHIRIDKDIDSGDSQKDASVLNYGTITAAQAGAEKRRRQPQCTGDQ